MTHPIFRGLDLHLHAMQCLDSSGPWLVFTTAGELFSYGLKEMAARYTAEQLGGSVLHIGFHDGYVAGRTGREPLTTTLYPDQYLAGYAAGRKEAAALTARLFGLERTDHDSRTRTEHDAASAAQHRETASESAEAARTGESLHS